MIQGSIRSCFVTADHLWIIQIWSLLLLPLLLLLLLILSNRAISCWRLMLLLFIHEVIVECLCHGWGKVLVLFFIFGIIRGWTGSVWWNIYTVIIDITIHMVTWNAIVSPGMRGFLELLIQRRCNNRSLIIGRLFGLLRLLVLHWLFTRFIWLLHAAVRYIDASTLQTFSAYLFAWLCLGKRGSVNDLWTISMRSSTTNYWSIKVIFIWVLVLKGRWGDLIEIWLFPKVITLRLWHHSFLIKLWRSVCNLDRLCVMRIRSLLELVCIVIISCRWSSTLLSLMVMIFEVWINRNEILFLYSPLLLGLFCLLPFFSIFRAPTPLSLLLWIFPCCRLWLWCLAELLWSTSSNQLLVMPLKRHIWVQLVHDLSGTLRATSGRENHRNIDFTSGKVTVWIGC